MDPSRFQRHVDALCNANAAHDVIAIATALKDVSRATYRDYTIKSFLAEAGTFPALVAASSLLPPDGSAEEAHSSVALCLWGLMIGHRPNKIKLVEQGGLPVLIKGLGLHAHEDCAQYSALAIWSLAYSVPENQLAAADSIPVLKALLEHRSALVQYAAAGALWAVSSHPLNREQLVLDKRLLATLLLFLPKSAPPLDENASSALPAPLSAPLLPLRPVQEYRPVVQSIEGRSAAGASPLWQEHGSTPGRPMSESVRRPRVSGPSRDELTPHTRGHAEEMLTETVGPSERVHSNRSATSLSRDVLSEHPQATNTAATLEAALHLRARLAETSSQLVSLGSESTRLRSPESRLSEGAVVAEQAFAVSTTPGPPSEAEAEARGASPVAEEPTALPPCRETPTGPPCRDVETQVPSSDDLQQTTEARQPRGEPAEQAPAVEDRTEARHRIAYREVRESWLEAAERLSDNLQRQTDFLSRRTQRLRGLSRTAPSVTEAAAAAARVNAESMSRSSGMTSAPSPTSVLRSSLHVSLPRGMPDPENAQQDESPLSEASPAPVLSVASGLGSESARVWTPGRGGDTPSITPALAIPLPQPVSIPETDALPVSTPAAPGPETNTAMEDLRTLVRTERARAEAFVTRARALVDEERAIRGNISTLERELAVAVRERDAAVAERDRTSAVLGRALAALSSARDQLAVLGGTLRASNSPLPIAPAPIPLATASGHRLNDGATPGVQPEEFELLEMLDSATGEPTSDSQLSRKACLMACLLLGNLSLSLGTKEPTMIASERWSEAMAGVLRFVNGIGRLDAFWATMLWTTVQPLVDLLQSPEAAVQALALYIVVDLCTGNEHRHKFIIEGAVPHLNRLCGSPSSLVRRLARSALAQLGMQPPVASPGPNGPKVKKPLETGGTEQDDVGECVICCDEASSAAFEPCGHVVSCLRCAQCLVARGDRCPLCRVAIGSVQCWKPHEDKNDL